METAGGFSGLPGCRTYVRSVARAYVFSLRRFSRSCVLTLDLTFDLTLDLTTPAANVVNTENVSVESARFLYAFQEEETVVISSSFLLYLSLSL